MRETGWLIECVGQNGPLWLYDDHEAPRQFAWTPDANLAIRFARESDAQSVMACCHIGHGIRIDGKPLRVFASEHMWIDRDDGNSSEIPNSSTGGVE